MPIITETAKSSYDSRLASNTLNEFNHRFKYLMTSRITREDVT
jgi:hypothetical protein